MKMENVRNKVNQSQLNITNNTQYENFDSVSYEQQYISHSNSSSDSDENLSETSSDEEVRHLTPQLNNIMVLNDDESLQYDSVMLSPPEDNLQFFEDLERIHQVQFISQYTEQQKLQLNATSTIVQFQETNVSQPRTDEEASKVPKLEEIAQPISYESCENTDASREEINNGDDEDLTNLTTDSAYSGAPAVIDNETKLDILKHVFQPDNSKNSLVVGDVSVQNSDHVHIGNVTIIKGPVNITQNITTVSQQNITNQLFVNANRVAPKRLNIINRRSWLAQPTLEDPDPMLHPAKYVVISHTATESGLTQAENVLLVRLAQTFHIESKGWNDIAYNFLIGCDGNVYEGRGWNIIGAHTYDYNRLSIGISFIGCFIRNLPPAHSIEACHALIQNGVESGFIDENYILLGHCQCSAVESPGKRLFEEIKTWPHWHDIHEEKAEN